jgi:hypothetical protein
MSSPSSRLVSEKKKIARPYRRQDDAEGSGAVPCVRCRDLLRNLAKGQVTFTSRGATWSARR